MDGWVKVHRKIFDNPVVCKDTDHLAVWLWLLCHAAFSPTDVMYGGKRMTLQPGQLTTGRKIIASELNVNEYKVQRILKAFENAQQIAQQTDHRCRLISIVSWDKYQVDAQQNAQEMHKSCTSDAQVMHTKEERKEREERKENYYSSRENNVGSNYIKRKSYDDSYRSDQDKKDYDDFLKECGVTV